MKKKYKKIDWKFYEGMVVGIAIMFLLEGIKVALSLN